MGGLKCFEIMCKNCLIFQYVFCLFTSIFAMYRIS